MKEALFYIGIFAIGCAMSLIYLVFEVDRKCKKLMKYYDDDFRKRSKEELEFEKRLKEKQEDSLSRKK